MGSIQSRFKFGQRGLDAQVSDASRTQFSPTPRSVDHVSYDLPSDVFGPGETKPTRTKVKKTKKTESTATKRRWSTAEQEVCPSSARGIVAYPRPHATEKRICMPPSIETTGATTHSSFRSDGEARRLTSPNPSSQDAVTGDIRRPKFAVEPATASASGAELPSRYHDSSVAPSLTYGGVSLTASDFS